MKKLLMALILALFVAPTVYAAGVDSQCVAKGIPLRGKVKVVKSNATFKVQEVTSFPDLKVQKVKSFPDKCGQWQFVDNFPDFTIAYVTAFPELKIKYVDAFPGKP